MCLFQPDNMTKSEHVNCLICKYRLKMVSKTTEKCIIDWEPSQLEKQNSHFILCLKAGLKRCPWRIIEKIFATKTVQLYILSVVMIKPEILTHHCNRTNHKMSITVAFSCWKRKEKKHKVRDKKVRDGMTVLNIINWLQKNT